MNMYEIRRETDIMCRTLGLDDMAGLRDEWINQAYEKLAVLFRIPPLKRDVTFGSVANQAYYTLPYDYAGTEVDIKHLRRRLDPVREETLKLKYERRQGSLGMVRYYDWVGAIGTDLFVATNCTLTNGSPVVQCATVSPYFDEDYWVRFDPYLDANNAEHDLNDMVNPGDFGYKITAGSAVPGVSFSLDSPYRGPSGALFTVRVRPAEQSRFVVYGIPTATDATAFEMTYYAKHKRLWNNSDVPEWSDLGLPLVYMAISMGFEWHHNIESANTFWGRAVQAVKGLQQRRDLAQMLVSDITIGGTVGRQTGIYGVFRRSPGASIRGMG
jgi:hypothetical protein